MGHSYRNWNSGKLKALVISPRRVRDLVCKLRHEDPDMRQFVYLTLTQWFLFSDIQPTLEAIAYAIQADSRLKQPFYTPNDVRAMHATVGHFEAELDGNMGDEAWMDLREPIDQAYDAMRVWWALNQREG